MHNTPYSQEIRQELKDWLSPYQFDWFLSLEPNNENMRRETLSFKINRFIYNVNKANYGRKSRRQLNWFVVTEANSAGWLHAHIAVGGDWVKLQGARTIEYVLASCWGDIQGLRQPIYSRLPLSFSDYHSKKERILNLRDEDKKGDWWFKPVTEAEGLVDYMTKTMRWDADIIDWDNTNRFHPKLLKKKEKLLH